MLVGNLCRQSGQTTIELPVVLWILFVILAFPLLDFCYLAFQVSIANNVANQAAEAFATSTTFTSGCTYAIPTASNTLASFGFSNTAYSASIIPASNGGSGSGTSSILGPYTVTSTSSSSIPSASLDTKDYNYLIQFQVNTNVSPLFPLPLFPSSYPIAAIATRFCENPSGLTQ